MADRVVQSSSRSTSSGWRERAGVIALAVGIVSVIAVYLALNAASGGSDTRGLLPYQTLVRTLPEPDQQQFRLIRQGLSAAETDRARTSAWPDPSSLGARGVAPFVPTTDGTGYQW